MKIDTTPSYHYHNVFIKPKFSHITSRKNVDTSQKLWGIKVNVPVVSANMDTVTDGAFASKMVKAGAQAAIHRFMTVEENVLEYQAFRRNNPIGECFCSLGVSIEEELSRFKALYNVGARWFIIDVANGASQKVEDMLKELQSFVTNSEKKKDFKLVVGNFATPEALRNFLDGDFSKFIDGYKIGIGPGCFAAGTRIMMANASYKNIEDVQPGEFVINKHGKATKVLRAFSTGKRDVVSYRTTSGIGETVCTADHKHWIGDISTNNNISSTGYKKVLDKKTRIGKSKYKWKEIGELTSNNAVLLMPRKIEFQLPETFSIELNSRQKHRSIMLQPSYELGYIFGTFLGDGTVHQLTEKTQRSNSIQWTFEKFQLREAKKLVAAIKTTTNLNAFITEKTNVCVVNFYCKPLADFLALFGKRTDKHLPAHLLVNDKEYQKGLFDGLIDSDGTHSPMESRIGFDNTSTQLLELFGILCCLTSGSFPNVEKSRKNKGKLLGLNVENLNKCYRSRKLINSGNRTTKDFQISKILEIPAFHASNVDVFDLEVEDETHSFIANNAIVHNSVCTTKNVTGVTVPQFSAVMDCVRIVRSFEEYDNFKRLVIADGGIRELGDVAKAIGAGADMVMIGKLFAECTDSLAWTKVKIAEEALETATALYRGMASAGAMEDFKGEVTSTPEGKEVALLRSKPCSHLIADIKGGLQSAMSYCNRETLVSFRGNAEFGVKYSD